MNILKLNFVFRLKIVFGLCLLVMNCNSNLSLQNVEEKNEPIPQLKADKKTRIDVKVPKGDEVSLKVEVIGRRKVRLTVSNISSKTVFLPYFAGGKNKYAYYAIYQIERKDDLTGEFKTFEMGHLGTGLHPLKPSDFYRDIYIDPERGTYRISVTYLIDEKVVEQINNLARLDKEQRLIEEKGNISKTITSEPFEL